MELSFDEIRVNRKVLIQPGCLSVKDNGITVLCGANGCGKTLLLKNIMMNLLSSNIDTAMLNQSKDVIVLSANVVENIAMSTVPEDCERVAHRVRELGFSGLLSKDVTRLSGGEARMVCILRCLLSAAKVLLIDEPTNDLDFAAVNRFVALLRQFRQEKTMLVVSHDDRIISVADEVAKINEGKIIGSGELLVDREGNAKEEPIGEKPDKEKTRNRRFQKNSNSDGRSGESFCRKRMACQQNPEKDNLSFKGEIRSGERGDFVKKMFPVNFVSFFVMLFVALVLSISLDSYCRASQLPDEIDPDNQLLLYQPCSKWADFVNGAPILKAFPAELVNVLRTGNVGDGLRTIQRTMNYIKNEMYYAIYCSLDEIKSTESYDVYPLEYYFEHDDVIVSVLEEYSEKYGMTENGTRPVRFCDTGGHFTVPNFYMGKDGVEFNYERWMDCAQALADKGATCCAAYVVLKDGHDAEEFFESDSFKLLYNKQVFVTSADIVRSIAELLGMWSIRNDFFLVLLLFAVMLLLAIGSNGMLLLSQMPKIRACRDYGVSCNSVWEGAEIRICCRLPILIPVFAFIVWNYFRVRNLPALQMNWLLTLVMCIGASLFYSVQRKTTKMFIRYCYRWNVR